jgi:SpoVK/Ycf46/Vps4 family AAA+-type ATPase
MNTLNPKDSSHENIFLQYLDAFQYKPSLTHQELSLILYEINYAFHTWVQRPEYENPFSHVALEMPKDLALTQNESFSYFTPNIQTCEEHLDSVLKSYKQSEADIFKIIEEKIILNIQVDVKTIADLLDIIDKHPYSPNIECNIDLKALHNIKTELQEINHMVGLKIFKDSLLDQLLYFLQNLHINKEHDYKHIAIYGPPGTGKTQIAKLVGTMYSKLGIMRNEIFKKVTRTDLVAGYLGQTAIKTNKVIQDCLGGVLFIDEVYSLGCGAGGGGNGDDSGAEGGDSYSKECIDTLCEALSNHKDDLMVIIAGYERDVQQYFFKMNPGLPSRFVWRFTIDDYTSEDLLKIFQTKLEQNGWEWNDSSSSSDNLLDWFTKKQKSGSFPYYGRDMEQLFTYTKIAHGRRIYGQPVAERKRLNMKDLNRGYDIFMKHGDETKRGKQTPESHFGLYL